MTVPRPSSKYADQMLDPGGWPATDETAIATRADDLQDYLKKVSFTLERWQHEVSDLKSGSTWAGAGANAGVSAIEKSIDGLHEQQSSLVRAITWLRQVSTNIQAIKTAIAAKVAATEEKIAALEAADLRGEVRQERIDALVGAAHDSNVADVENAADTSRFQNFSLNDEQLTRSLENLLKEGTAASPDPASQNSRNGESSQSPPTPAQQGGIQTIRNGGPTPANMNAAGGESGDLPAAPPPAQAPADQPPADMNAGSGPTGNLPDAPAPEAPPPATPPAANLGTPLATGDLPDAPPAPGPTPTFTPAPAGTSSGPSVSQPTTPISTGGVKGGTPGNPSIGGAQGPSGGTGGGGPQAPAATAGPGQGSGAAPVNTPQQDFQKGFTDATKAANANPMPLNQTPLSSAAPPPQPAAPVYQPADTSSSTSPAATTSHSAPATSAPAPAAPPPPSAPTGPPPMPLGNPSTPSPAAPVPPSAGPVGPAVAPASTNQGAAGAAPVPISAARAERDAIAAAATAGAMRRKGPNPRQLARHIGAALNVDITDPSLFWITAVTSDGQILAANNYGLAYIPEHVHLPEQVRMVTADESIPAQIRGTWATYPLLAVQEWARHHNVTLQAVAGTEENLKGFDLGAARDIITPEDMPDSGKMQGRNRLEVIAPEVAIKLAGISASGLTELLPPAPADNTPPADNRINLLLEVCKPLLSANPDRAGAHLKAMVAYADHLQDVALFRAHNAQDAELQRAAIAEWIYWQHISVLSADALAAMVS